jgi:Eco29kI restriction endonuclease
MKPRVFDRQEHVYKNDAFTELVKDAIRFFNGTPVHTLPPPESFIGTGVYALYYTGINPLYEQYAELNRLAYNHPIYVGKAVPKGWRQSRASDQESTPSKELFSRIKEHGRSLTLGEGLSLDEFSCRFMIFNQEGSDMISTIEAALIKLNKPLWNTAIDGFGNRDPGSGRYEQAKSDWDVIHAGRAWAEKCKGQSKTKSSVMIKIERYFKELGN